jgi:hypothetical protein
MKEGEYEMTEVRRIPIVAAYIKEHSDMPLYCVVAILDRHTSVIYCGDLFGHPNFVGKEEAMCLAARVNWVGTISGDFWYEDVDFPWNQPKDDPLEDGYRDWLLHQEAKAEILDCYYHSDEGAGFW